MQSLRLSRKAQRLLGSHLQTAVRQRLPLASAQQGVELYQQEMSAGKVLLVADPEQLPVER